MRIIWEIVGHAQHPADLTHRRPGLPGLEDRVHKVLAPHLGLQSEVFKNLPDLAGVPGILVRLDAVDPFPEGLDLLLGHFLEERVLLFRDLETVQPDLLHPALRDLFRIPGHGDLEELPEPALVCEVGRVSPGLDAEDHVPDPVLHLVG